MRDIRSAPPKIGEPVKGKFWGFVRRNAAPYIGDLIVLFGAAAWWTSFFQAFGLFAYLLTVGLLRWERFDRLLVVRALYALVSVLFLDAVLINYFPLYCVSKLALALWMVSIPACLFFLIKTRGLSIRTFTHSFIPALLLGFLIVGKANQPSTCGQCEAARSQKKLRMLVDLTRLERPHGIPRFIAYRPDRKDLIITYRSGTPMPSLKVDEHKRVFADRLDLKTGAIQPIDAISSECIGIYYNRARGQIVSANVHKGDRQHPKTLSVLDANLRAVKVLDFPRGDDDDYVAFMMPYKDKIAIYAEVEDAYLFDPNDFKLTGLFSWDKSGLIPRCRIPVETGFLQVSPNQFLVTGFTGPLTYNLVRAHDICLYDVSKQRFVKSYRRPFGGTWSVAAVPDRDELLVTSAWRDKIWAVSAKDLTYRRTLSIGPCVRSVGYSSKRKLGYTVECFTGNLVSFDVVTGQIKDKIYIGKNARTIYNLEDAGMGMVFLSGCGVFQLR